MLSRFRIENAILVMLNGGCDGVFGGRITRIADRIYRTESFFASSLSLSISLCVIDSHPRSTTTKNTHAHTNKFSQMQTATLYRQNHIEYTREWMWKWENMHLRQNGTPSYMYSFMHKHTMLSGVLWKSAENFVSRRKFKIMKCFSCCRLVFFSVYGVYKFIERVAVEVAAVALVVAVSPRCDGNIAHRV